MKSDCGQGLQEVTFPKGKNIIANIKQVTTKFYKLETNRFPSKYYATSKNIDHKCKHISSNQNFDRA